MTKKWRMLGALAVSASLASFSPYTVDLSGEREIVRLNSACAQATSCRVLTDYVCSTFHQDWQHMTCATGCNPVGHE